MFKLEVLDLYYQKNRQIGHTLAMLNGAKFDKNYIVIIAHNAQKNYIDLPKEQFVSIDELHRLKGLNKPVLVDHYALQLMYYEMNKELLKKDEEIDMLKIEVKKLEERLSY